MHLFLATRTKMQRNMITATEKTDAVAMTATSAPPCSPVSGGRTVPLATRSVGEDVVGKSEKKSGLYGYSYIQHTH